MTAILNKSTRAQLLKGGWTAFFSESGSTAFMFIVSLLFLYDYQSPELFSLIQLIRPITVILLNPFLGNYVDGHNKRKIALTSQLGMVAVFVLLFLITQLSLNQFTYILLFFGSITIITVCMQLRQISYQASVISMVPSEAVNKMVSTQQTCSLAANLMAPFIGSAFYSTVGFHYSLVFITVTEFAVWLGIFSLNFDFNPDKQSQSSTPHQNKSTFSNIVAGFNLLKFKKELFYVVCLGAVINFFLAALNTGLPIIISNVKQMSPNSLATINVALAIGMILGGIISNFVKNQSFKFISLYMSIIGLIMGGIGLITLSDNRSMLLVGIGIAVLLIGIMIVITNIIISTYIKQQTPIEFQGRISATTSTLASIMSPIGIIIYGYTFAHLSPAIIYIFSGLIISTISLISKAKKHTQL